MVHFQNEVRHQVDIWLNDDTNSSENALAIPNKQEFAINNIQMNMTKKDVENKSGHQKRVTSK